MKRSETKEMGAILDNRALGSEEREFFEKIRVNLKACLGELRMSAAQLFELQPGDTFEFEFDLSKRLSLCLEEEKVAEAVLVMYQKRLALQIVAIENSSEKYVQEEETFQEIRREQ